MAIKAGDSVTIEYTGRLEDGTVFDTSQESVAEETGLASEQPEREYEPLTVEIGEGRIIEGLEEALIGQESGASPTVAIPPEKAYGPWSEDQLQEYERAEFEEMVGGETPEEGAYLETQDGSLAEVTHVDELVVSDDFNHTLAGETLEFDVDIVDVN
jgi:FKBP-type peptidyl-prolyl cis-trans isomerase 2